MTCPLCGTPVVPGARFCFACGAALAGLPPADAETERRVVTVLFGDLSDFTGWAEDLDPERVGVVTDRVLAQLAATVHEFGGTVDKLTGDGIMAVFGAPTAHEDDAERAVRAAARMQATVRRLVEEESGGGRRLGLRVGLNTGEVVAGVQASLSYTVVGDTVNTAARLSDAAGVGEVCAGRETALGTGAVASWRALAPLRLKGKREPVLAYELVGLRPPGAAPLGTGEEVPFLGRDGEFGTLVGHVLDVVDGAGPRAVLVHGEAGVGKTRLARELARFAGELPGARVLWGRCVPYGEGRDLAPVADLVRTACGIADTDDADAARARVDRLVARLQQPAYAGPVPPGLAEALRALLGLEEVPGPAAVSEGVAPGAPAGDRLVPALAALFTRLAADGLLVLVLDDLHWATPVMLEGLLDVARRVRGPVLLLALGRSELLGRRARAGEGGALPPGWDGTRLLRDVLVLAPLDEGASERLLRAYLRVAPAGLDPAVRDVLLRRAQGNPFFLAELLHLLVDRGVLRRDGDAWQLIGELSEDLLPTGVQAVLAARIDGLPGPVRAVLRDASVLGLQFSSAALVAVGEASGHGRDDVGRAEVERAVDVLVERRLVERDDAGDRGPGDRGPGDRGAVDRGAVDRGAVDRGAVDRGAVDRGAVDRGAGTLRFSHTLVRDVAYAGVPKAERARRHAAAAAHAAQAGRTGEADLAAAGHGERAVQLAVEMALPRTDPAWQARGTAFTALARLGQAALARDDAVTARSTLSRALQLDRPVYGEPLPPELVVPARVAHAQALAVLHRLDDAEAELAPALAAAEQGLRAGALVVLGDVRRRRGDAAQARAAFVSALAAAGDAGIDRLSGEALRQLGLLDYFDGRLRDAERSFRAAHALAERVGDARGAGWALQHLAWSATTRGDYPLADEVLEDAADVFARLDDTGGLSWVAGTEGFVRLLQGRLSEAREVAGSLLPSGEAAGERWGVAALLVIDALAAAELGDVPEAEREAQRAREQFADLRDAWGQALALVASGAATRAAGAPERAVELHEQAVRLTERRHPLVAGLALMAAGHAALDAGDLATARTAAERAGALLGGLDLEPHAAVGVQVLHAQVLRREGRTDEALAALDGALRVACAPALLFPRRQALAHRAGVLLELGRGEDALAAAADAVGTPSEDVRSRVLALRAYGSALRACGRTDEAACVLHEALGVARSTGMTAEVATTERLLAAAGAEPVGGTTGPGATGPGAPGSGISGRGGPGGRRRGS